MSEKRPELRDCYDKLCMDYESSFFRIMQAVEKTRTLIHGQLHDKNGHSCAIGCAFDDGVKSLRNEVIDEIATYNDSFPKLTGKERWEKVLAWLRFRTDIMRKHK